jgi:hypothetical protein
VTRHIIIIIIIIIIDNLVPYHPYAGTTAIKPITETEQNNNQLQRQNRTTANYRDRTEQQPITETE